MTTTNAINGVNVHTLVFSPDGFVELTYSEDKDQSPDIQVMKIMRLDPARSGRVVMQLVDDIVDIVEAALIRLSGAPDTIPGRQN